MKLKVNGTVQDYSEDLHTVADFLQLALWQGRQVIVEHNGEVIAKAHWGETRLADNDVLELVYFVGGG